MLPDIDGMEVCRTLRQQQPARRIPILMLTARGEEIDRVVGFELGADDYVSKPFSPRELVLRVKSILRRSHSGSTDVFGVRNIQVYPERRQCFVGNELVSLTLKEFDLLQELMKARGNVLSRETLMVKVWGYHGDATSRTLDTHVRRLREKLGRDGDCIETVRGVGYRISDVPAAPAVPKR
jgi:two-component system phosphate regulon response regulator PhoB